MPVESVRPGDHAKPLGELRLGHSDPLPKVLQQVRKRQGWGCHLRFLVVVGVGPLGARWLAPLILPC
ncbi:hypothetical protein GCM10010191_82560 [Actinomadura vinacea]|uniref:Uncharacterized protein n=1 Tax=Actinomadura vinacea TaxID=115336 RepID=A0ABN3K7J9_9ACTN